LTTTIAATVMPATRTDAALDKAQCTKLASMAHDGLARSLSPIHTPFDGDTLFALATGSAGQARLSPGLIGLIGVLAADVTARAVRHAVEHARGRPGCPAARDLAGPL
jgi:L-aminopeptidase/D-esterase-like protein